MSFFTRVYKTQEAMRQGWNAQWAADNEGLSPAQHDAAATAHRESAVGFLHAAGNPNIDGGMKKQLLDLAAQHEDQRILHETASAGKTAVAKEKAKAKTPAKKAEVEKSWAAYNSQFASAHANTNAAGHAALAKYHQGQAKTAWGQWQKAFNGKGSTGTLGGIASRAGYHEQQAAWHEQAAADKAGK